MLRLPAPLGPRTAWVNDLLTEQPGGPSRVDANVPTRPSDDPLADEDLQLALLTVHELSYEGVTVDGETHVDDRWENDLRVCAARNAWEGELLAAVRAGVGDVDEDTPIVAWFQELVNGEDDGLSTSGWLREHGTLTHVREEAVHRSIYQLQEADPHTFGIPRLRGAPKAALVEIQADEYGEGRLEDMHAELFAHTMRGLDLSIEPHHYAEAVHPLTLATVNLVRTFARSRATRGELVGHLALFELASVPVMSTMSGTYERLGCNTWSRLFFDVHVVADADHQNVALHELVAGLVEREPSLDPAVRFGAAALAHCEARLAEHVIGCWSEGHTSLRAPLPDVTIDEIPAGDDVPLGSDPRRTGLASSPDDPPGTADTRLSAVAG